jgi:PAS domain S-box-containing protein
LIHDITERKQAEEALRQGEERFRNLVETTSDFVWEVDERGLYTYASPKVLDVLGYEPEEVLGRTPFDFMPPKEARGVRAIFQERLAKGEPISSLENLNIHKDGREVILETSGVPFSDQEGRVRGYRGIDRDITERKRAEEELRESEEKYRSLVETTNTGYLIVDLQGRVLDANAEYVRLTGHRSLEEILGRSVLDWTAGHDLERNAREVAKCGRLGYVRGLEIDYVDRQGNTTPIEVNATVIKTPMGPKILALCRDITDRKRAEESVMRANEELLRVGRLKDEFISLASHELKTPVTSMKIFSQLLARRPEIVPQVADTLNRQADQLTVLINDLLDVARLQLGQMPMEMRPLDLAELLAGLCERQCPLYEEREVTCPRKEEEILVEGDPVRLEQVVTNLLSNAAKFSSPGDHIWMRVSREADKALVEVQDEGMGISPENLSQIFERFQKPRPQQAQAAYPGLGVGLYISRNIVERHGGRIWAESEPGKGSTFHVELPLLEGEGASAGG